MISSSKNLDSPFIISVQNSSGVDIQDVAVGNSYGNRTKTPPFYFPGIRITFGITGISFADFLAQSENTPFKVGRAMIVAEFPTDPAQLETATTIFNKDSNGNVNRQVFMPTLDPFQRAADRILIDYSFLFDGYSYIQFANISSGSLLTIYLYPEGDAPAKEFFAANPIIARAQGSEQVM